MAKTLFFDDFEDGVIDKKWDLTGIWDETDGYLACVESNVKFNYAVPKIPAEFHSKTDYHPGQRENHRCSLDPNGHRGSIDAKTQQREAQDGKPTGHLGYCLTTTENGPSDVKLLNEGVQWVNLNKPVRPQLDQWIWVQLTVTDKQRVDCQGLA